MKIVTVAPLLLLGAALASIEGLPYDNRRSSNSKMYEDWNDAIELARNKSGVPGLSVAVLHRGEVVYAEGFGKRNDKGDPVTAEVKTPAQLFFGSDCYLSQRLEGVLVFERNQT